MPRPVSVPPVGNCPTYDVSAWPIVRVTLPSVALSIEAYRAHLERLNAVMYGRREPCLLLLDARQHPALDAIQRKLTAEFAAANERAYPGLLRGVAFVSKSRLARGAFTAVAWMYKKSYPRKAFATTTEARAWVSELLPR